LVEKSVGESLTSGQVAAERREERGERRKG